MNTGQFDPLPVDTGQVDTRKYTRYVRILRISPWERLKEVNPLKIDGLKTQIALLQLELTNLEQNGTDENTESSDLVAQRERLRNDVARANEALKILEKPFLDILLVWTVEGITSFDIRIPVSSRPVPNDTLYDIDYYGRDLLKVLKKENVFNKPVTNVYEYNNEIGTYQDLTCGGIYRRELVFTFSFKETPRSEAVLVRFVRKAQKDSEEPKYYPVLSSGHIAFKSQEDVLDNPQYVFESMAEETLPNAGSILCARVMDAQGSITYYGVNMDGTIGNQMEFPGEDLRERLRTPFNEGQVL